MQRSYHNVSLGGYSVSSAVSAAIESVIVTSRLQRRSSSGNLVSLANGFESIMDWFSFDNIDCGDEDDVVKIWTVAASTRIGNVNFEVVHFGRLRGRSAATTSKFMQ